MRQWLATLGLVVVLMVSGCAAHLGQTVDDYMAAAGEIELGMHKEQVVAILGPTQARLRNTEIKPPDRYVKDGVQVEILYFRSGWQDDGLTTDDEFTPYVFHDGRLVSIGWETLGGPKSQGQARPNTNVYFHGGFHHHRVIH